MNSENATAKAAGGGSRRDYLMTAWKALGLVAAAECAAVVGAFLWPRAGGEDDQRAAVIDAGPVAEFTPASVTAFPGGRFYLVRLADGGFPALSSKCPHLGCTVPWNEKDKTFPCPCHASVFDMTGNVESPPAPRALDLFPVRIEAGVVRVDTRSRVQRQRFERSWVTYLSQAEKGPAFLSAAAASAAVGRWRARAALRRTTPVRLAPRFARRLASEPS